MSRALAALSSEELLARAARLSHEQLAEAVAHAEASRPAGSPAASGERQSDNAPPPKRQKPSRRFDMSRYAQRHVAFRIAYIGTDYHGLAWSADTPMTIEGKLFEALEKTCLIVDRQSCHKSAGGRTDKGVSALGQVIACYVRSTACRADGVEAEEAEEIDYVRVLNRVLPADIRVLAWRPVEADFSARFSATHRTYKYFFVRGRKDIAAMREAAQLLLGEHDFRNFCKIDPSLQHYRRSIASFEVQPVAGFSEGEPLAPTALWEFTVVGQAFMWHQVRCMVAVLFLVGDGKERPSIVADLLDVKKFPSRPNYEMASEAPLLLYDIAYAGIEWTYSPATLASVAAAWLKAQHDLSLRSAMYHSMRHSLWGRRVANPLADEAANPPSAEGRELPTAPLHAEARAAAAAMAQLADCPAALPPSKASFVPWGSLCAQLLGAMPPAEGEPSGSCVAAARERTAEYVPLAMRPTAASAEAKSAKHKQKQARGES